MTASTTLPQPLMALSGSDPNVAALALASLYDGRDLTTGPTDDTYWFRYVGMGDDRFSIRRLQVNGWLRAEGTTGGDVVVQWSESGRSTVDIGQGPAIVPMGVPTPLPTGRLFRAEHQHPDQRLVHLSRALVLDIASEQYEVHENLAFAAQPSPNRDMVSGWRTAITLAIAALRSHGDASLAWSEAQADVARALLRMYPLKAEPLQAGAGDRADVRISSAVEYLHAHAQEPLTVADVAAAANVSVRTLQDSFRRTLNRSPMSYLKSVRLEQAHAELLTGEAGTVGVAEIARSWGFNHMGRFSASYARHFGEYPQQTLRR